MSPVKTDILDGKYVLTQIWDDEKMVNTSKRKSTIKIDSKTTRITAHFGCNSMSGEFVISRYLINPVNLMSTEMFCSTSINNLESLFGKQISKVNHFTIEKNIVKFYAEEQVVMVFKKVVPKAKKK